MAISPETYAELRRFIREQSPAPDDEPEGMGEPLGTPGPSGVEIEVKSEPEGGAKTCPACGQHVP
jgi:hypothetical protein